MKYRLIFFAFVMLAFSALSVSAQAVTQAASACVTDYDPQVDYFPDKVEPEFSQGWRVEYHNHYKVVDVLTPFPGAEAADALEYVLVQCGTPAPEGYDDAQVIEIPADTVIAMSTTYIPHLADLGLLDHLIGMDTAAYINNPTVRQMAADGKLIEIGSGPGVNVEAVLNAEPSLVLTYGSGVADYDTHPVLLDAGVPVVVASDFIEASPLGQAEWIKFVALFFNREADANAVFEGKSDEYDRLAALTAPLEPAFLPTVLWNSYSTYANAWAIPGSESFAAQYLHDAGGRLVLGDDPQVQGNNNAVPFDFEVVYNAGLDADFWMPNLYAVQTMADVIAQDERYADFAAVKNFQVYNDDARVNANGGNDFYESGVANPQDVLADLIAILHPNLLPDHELIYFRPLPPAR